MRHFTWAVLVILGCSPKPPLNEGTAGGMAETCLTGVVGVVGSEGFQEVVIRPAEGSPVVLRGDQPLRVARLLTGGEIEACGVGGEPSGYGPTLQISKVNLLKMDGMEAWLGVLSRGGSGWLLNPEGNPRQDVVPLVSVPDDLAAAVGHHVWIAGDWRDGVFVVRSFGLLPGMDAT